MPSSASHLAAPVFVTKKNQVEAPSTSSRISLQKILSGDRSPTSPSLRRVSLGGYLQCTLVVLLIYSSSQICSSSVVFSSLHWQRPMKAQLSQNSTFSRNPNFQNLDLLSSRAHSKCSHSKCCTAVKASRRDFRRRNQYSYPSTSQARMR